MLFKFPNFQVDKLENIYWLWLLNEIWYNKLMNIARRGNDDWECLAVTVDPVVSYNIERPRALQQHVLKPHLNQSI